MVSRGKGTDSIGIKTQAANIYVLEGTVLQGPTSCKLGLRGRREEEHQRGMGRGLGSGH